MKNFLLLFLSFNIFFLSACSESEDHVSQSPKKLAEILTFKHYPVSIGERFDTLTFSYDSDNRVDQVRFIGPETNKNTLLVSYGTGGQIKEIIRLNYKGDPSNKILPSYENGLLISSTDSSLVSNSATKTVYEYENKRLLGIKTYRNNSLNFSERYRYDEHGDLVGATQISSASTSPISIHTENTFGNGINAFRQSDIPIVLLAYSRHRYHALSIHQIEKTVVTSSLSNMPVTTNYVVGFADDLPVKEKVDGNVFIKYVYK